MFKKYQHNHFFFQLNSLLKFKKLTHKWCNKQISLDVNCHVSSIIDVQIDARFEF